MSFKALKVWRALKRNPGAHNRDLRADLGWTEYSIAQILLNLEEKGCARRVGHSWQRRWWATETRPLDGRGAHPASQAAIKPYQHFAVARLAKANYKKGRKPRRVPVPQPATELERCWGFIAGAVPIRQEPGDD